MHKDSRGKLYYLGLSFFMIFFLTACIRVTGMTPAMGKENVSRNAEIIASFSIDPDPISINKDTFFVKDDSGNVIDGGIVCSGRKIIFKPSLPLIYATRYDVTIKGTVRNQSGLYLKSDFKSSFTTEAPAGLNVISTFPANHGTNAQRDSAVKIYFDSKLDPLSTSSEAICLKSQTGETMKTRISVAGNCLKIEHEKLLDVNTTYAVNISKDIRHINGWVTASENTFEFKTRDGLWRSVDLPFSSVDVDPANIKLAFSPDGYAFAVWSQIEGLDDNNCPIYNIHASRWNKITWEDPQPIGVPSVLCDGSSIFDVQFAFSMEGHEAMVFWAQSFDAGQSLPGFSVYSNCWNGTTWKGVQTVGTAGHRSTGASRYPGQLSLAYGPDDKAIATWVYWEFAGEYLNCEILYSVWEGNAWNRPQRVFPTTTDFIIDQQIALDRKGLGMLIYKKTGKTSSGVYSRRFNGLAWENEDLLGAMGNSINLAFLFNGDALTAWFGGSRYETSLMACRWNVEANAWEQNVLIGNAYPEPYLKPSIAVSPNGDAFMAWKDGEYKRTIFASRWSKKSWGIPQIIAEPLDSVVLNPEVAFSLNGDVIIVWWQKHMILGKYDLCMRKLNCELNIWEDTQKLKSVEYDDLPESMHLATGPDSSAVLIWKKGDGLYSMVFD